jgi:multiple sugar transport system permease protein
MRPVSVAHTTLRLSFLIAGVIVVAFPFANMVLTAVTSEHELFANPARVVWIPSPVRLENFSRVLAFRNMDFVRAFRNTIFVISVVIVTTVITSSWIAYGFSMIDFRGRNLLFVLMLSTMMIPSQVKLIPQFLLFSRIGWVDTYLPLMVWGFFGNPFYIFLIRQFALGIPRSLVDAARVDGCSHVAIYWRIVMPQLTPILTAVAVFLFIGEWRNLLGPLIYIRSQRLYTIAMELNRFQGFVSGTTGSQLPLTNLLLAASTLTMIPPVLVFVIGQRHFLRSLDVTSGIKG